jgi:protoporphyrinogen oxidase
VEELVSLGLADRHDIVDACVIRQEKAYPIYDDHYREHVAAVREELEASYPNLYLVGRNGMHKYNNQDHAMMTGLLTALNIEAGEPIYDVWQVNEDAEYHEAGPSGVEDALSSERLVPRKVAEVA